jgi:hypothetical protein
MTRPDTGGEVAGASIPQDRDLPRPDRQIDSPLLLTRAQAAQLCQVSVEILDQWSYEPGFPVIRRKGGHFVRIHRTALERWLEQFALASNPCCAGTTRRRGLAECGRHQIIDLPNAGLDGTCWCFTATAAPELHQQC